MADKPRRIQRSRVKGWKMPPNTVYVGRPTRWGNPFGGALAAKHYERWLHGDMSVESAAQLMRWPVASHMRPAIKARAAWDLRGQNLACWCALDQPCHADVLLELANAPPRCEAAIAQEPGHD